MHEMVQAAAALQSVAENMCAAKTRILKECHRSVDQEWKYVDLNQSLKVADSICLGTLPVDHLWSIGTHGLREHKEQGAV